MVFADIFIFFADRILPCALFPSTVAFQAFWRTWCSQQSLQTLVQIATTLEADTQRALGIRLREAI